MEEEKRSRKFIIDDTVYETRLTNKFRARKPYVPHNPKMVVAFIPGVIRDINVKIGQRVKEGDQLLILEAMKMKNVLLSHKEGKIKKIKIQSGEMVLKNQLLIEFE
ncbi:acetyl-CoA carboxylase biotin carboxyl carrier protein subunit [bacterium]|nr:acetyl-CoA carboxylase biotin carboxyl carrier protein subunit [bacterium]